MKRLEEITTEDLQNYSMESLQELASDQVGRYKKSVKEIKDLDSPMYTSDVKDYETKKERQTLDANMKNIEKAYQDAGSERIAELEREAALTSITPSPKDKELADSLVREAKFQVSMATSEDAKQDSISNLKDKLQYLDRNQKVALKDRLPELLGQSDKSDQTVRMIGNNLSEIKTEAEGALNLMKQDVRSGVGIEYRNMKLAEQTGKELRQEFGGVDDGSSELSTTKESVQYRSM